MKLEPPANDLFPLPLNSIEKFHWFDSTAGFNNLVYCRFRFTGVVDADAGQRASERFVSRHPLLAASVHSDSTRLFWQWTPEKIDVTNWQQRIDAMPGPLPIDLKSGPPWRIICRNDGHQTELWFYMSHVLGDGLAGIQAIGDWMKFYHQQITGDATKRMPTLRASDLQRRGQLGLAKKKYLKQIYKQPVGLLGASKFIFRKPAELVEAPEHSEDWNAHHQPAIIGRWLDKNSSYQIKNRAKSLNVSMNALLAGQLMKTLHQKCLSNRFNRSPWIRLIQPMSIRDFSDRRMPLANRTSIVQLDRREADFARADFFSGLDFEIGIIREWELSKLFLLFVRGMSCIPGAIKRSASNPKCRGTAVFANLASPFGRIGLPVEDGQTVVGNLRLLDFDFVGPIRNRMPVNFSVQRHLGRFRISLHYDPRAISNEHAEHIIDDYQMRLIN